MKTAKDTPLTLKAWVFDESGKPIEQLIKECFLEFYFTKKISEN